MCGHVIEICKHYRVNYHVKHTQNTCRGLTFFSFPAFKLAQVDIYRQRLKERARRKKIAREYSIIPNSTTVGLKRVQANKKKLTKEEKLVIFNYFSCYHWLNSIFFLELLPPSRLLTNDNIKMAINMYLYSFFVKTFGKFKSEQHTHFLFWIKPLRVEFPLSDGRNSTPYINCYISWYFVKEIARRGQLCKKESGTKMFTEKEIGYITCCNGILNGL